LAQLLKEYGRDYYSPKRKIMKPTLFALRSFILLTVFTLMQFTLLAQAQDNGSSSTTSTSKTSVTVTESASEWYTSPWVWIVGAAIFILLLVALLSPRGGDRSDTVVVKKTVERDRDVDVV
jgi:hypothetical protein